jgi:hypothetical protein
MGIMKKKCELQEGMSKSKSPAMIVSRILCIYTSIAEKTNYLKPRRQRGGDEIAAVVVVVAVDMWVKSLLYPHIHSLVAGSYGKPLLKTDGQLI